MRGVGILVALALLLAPAPCACAEGEDGRVELDCGVSQRELYRLDEAERCFRRAAELLPQSAEPLAHLAELKARRGEEREARAAAERALALDPKSQLAAEVLGTLAELGRLRASQPPEPPGDSPEHAVWARLREPGWELVGPARVQGDRATVSVRRYVVATPDLGRAPELARRLEHDPVYQRLGAEERVAYVRRIANLGGPEIRVVDFELYRRGHGWSTEAEADQPSRGRWWLALVPALLLAAWLWRRLSAS
jgi:tetratricopeptide (TPR) repeat protein